MSTCGYYPYLLVFTNNRHQIGYDEHLQAWSWPHQTGNEMCES